MNERDKLAQYERVVAERDAYKANAKVDSERAEHYRKLWQEKTYAHDRLLAENERLRADLATIYNLLNQPVYGHESVSDNACKVMRADAATIRDRIRAALAAWEVRHG